MNDVGAMANIFLKSSGDDDTAQLLYPRDGIWPVIVEMLRNYLADDYTYVRVAWDEYTDTIVGWTSISLVTSDQEDYFKFCDSTVWAGRQLLFREAQASPGGPPHVDTMRRSGLITQLRNHNCRGQNRHINGGQYLVINTMAIHPEVFVDEIPTIAYKLVDDARDLAIAEDLPLWAQIPQSSMVELEDLEDIFREAGFAEVASFELDLTRYASEDHRRRRYVSHLFLFIIPHFSMSWRPETFSAFLRHISYDSRTIPEREILTPKPFSGGFRSGPSG